MATLTQRLKFLAILSKMKLQKSNFSTSSSLAAFKWKYAEKGNNATFGMCQGHPDDPTFHTNDVPYAGTLSNGEPVPEFLYRRTLPEPTYMDRMLTWFLGSVLWSWFVYHLYWHSNKILGHAYMPYLCEFTDEELGIPPDDEEDPVYWGNHGKEWGTYR